MKEIAMSVVILVLSFYSAFITGRLTHELNENAIYEQKLTEQEPAQEDWEEYKTKWDETGYSYSELWDKYSEISKKSPLTAISKDVVVGKINESTLVTVYPYSNDVIDAFAGSPGLLLNSIKEADATKCIAIFISEETGVMGGMIISNDGTIKRLTIEIE